MFDLNDASPQTGPMGELIPDGTFAKVQMTIRPGGVNGTAPSDVGLLKASTSSDAMMLDCEFTVLEGPFARRKFWQMFTVSGGKLDDKGVSKGWNISKSYLRAMIDSALGLDPKDMSEAAKAKRVIQGLKDFNGIKFVARIMVEPNSSPQYPDANKLANVVLPSEPQYAPVMKGETVPPEPANVKPRKQRDEAAVTPAWQGGGGQTTSAPQSSGTQTTAQPSQPGPAWLQA